MNSRKKKKRSAKAAPAYWTASGKGPMFTACSKCGFQIETLRAVETGWTSTEYVGIRYRFCPSCGSPMHLKNRTEDAT